METEYNAKRAWSALIVVVIGTIMAMLDQTIVNIAVPSIMTDLNTDLITSQWIISAYALTLAAVIPLTSYFSKSLGSKRLYMISLVLFTLGSVLCGMSDSINQLIMFRIIQAIGGGMMAPMGMAIILDKFPAEKRGMAFGVYGVGVMAAPAVGPTLGGFVISALNWRYVFFINIPIGIIAIAASYFLLDKSKFQKFGKFDILGFITFLSSIVLFIYEMGNWNELDISETKYQVVAVVIIVSLILFIFNEKRVSNPLINLKVFNNFTFVYATILLGINGIVLMGISYSLPLYWQNVQGLTPMHAGEVMLPASIVVTFGMLASGRLLSKLGIRRVVIPGYLVLTIGILLLAKGFSADTSVMTMIAYSCVVNAGISFIMMPINTNSLSTVEHDLNVDASQVSNISRQLFSSVGVIISSTLITTFMENNAADYTDPKDLFAASLTHTAHVTVYILVVAVIMALFLKTSEQRKGNK